MNRTGDSHLFISFSLNTYLFILLNTYLFIYLLESWIYTEREGNTETTIFFFFERQRNGVRAGFLPTRRVQA